MSAPAPLWRRAAAGTFDGMLQGLTSEALTRAARIPRPEGPRTRRRWEVWRRRHPPRRQVQDALFGAGRAAGRTDRRYHAVSAAGTLSTAVPMLFQGGRTPGQRALGMRLIREDGAEAGTGRALVRGLVLPGLAYGALLARSPEALGATALAAIVDGLAVLGTERRTLRDRALGTRMVVTGD